MFSQSNRDDGAELHVAISSRCAEALRVNVGITGASKAAAVLIVMPISMKGLLCLLPDLLRHVCLETQVHFHTGQLTFTGQDDVGLVRAAPC